jgi:hypothetical protein
MHHVYYIAIAIGNPPSPLLYLSLTTREKIRAAISQILDSATPLPSRDPRATGVLLFVNMFGGLLLRPFPVASAALVRSFVQRRARLWFLADGEGGISTPSCALLRMAMNVCVRACACASLCCVQIYEIVYVSV